jgi:hypothetical protein
MQVRREVVPHDDSWPWDLHAESDRLRANYRVFAILSHDLTILVGLGDLGTWAAPITKHLARMSTSPSVRDSQLGVIFWIPADHSRWSADSSDAPSIASVSLVGARSASLIEVFSDPRDISTQAFRQVLGRPGANWYALGFLDTLECCERSVNASIGDHRDSRSWGSGLSLRSKRYGRPRTRSGRVSLRTGAS